jgi:hypothetical protein
MLLQVDVGSSLLVVANALRWSTMAGHMFQLCYAASMDVLLAGQVFIGRHPCLSHCRSPCIHRAQAAEVAVAGA